MTVHFILSSTWLSPQCWVQSCLDTVCLRWPSQLHHTCWQLHGRRQRTDVLIQQAEWWHGSPSVMGWEHCAGQLQRVLHEMVPNNRRGGVHRSCRHWWSSRSWCLGHIHPSPPCINCGNLSGCQGIRDAYWSGWTQCGVTSGSMQCDRSCCHCPTTFRCIYWVQFSLSLHCGRDPGQPQRLWCWQWITGWQQNLIMMTCKPLCLHLIGQTFTTSTTPHYTDWIIIMYTETCNVMMSSFCVTMQ